jgi:thiamine monophosphate kinase
MRADWMRGEKDFLADLHKSMNKKGLDWRDDAIIVPISDDMSLLYSIDNVSKIKDFSDREKTMICYGKWAASVICNDIIACGVLPKGLALDIGIEELSENDFNNFIKGVLYICDKYGTIYEGGNINTFNSVSGIAWGISSPEKIIKRTGAKDKSIILATTDIGVGWAVNLITKWSKAQNISLDNYMELREHLELISTYKENPCINVDLFKEVWDLNIIQCGMDLTDGILEFGHEIYERTNLGVIFNFQNPIHPIIRIVAKVLDYPSNAFYFDPGYDTPFAHGWCIDEKNLSKALDVFDKHKAPYTILGYTTTKVEGIHLNLNSTLIQLPRYWDDKVFNRGSIDNWEKIILPIFEVPKINMS